MIAEVTESDAHVGLERPSKRSCKRYSKEQVEILHSEFDRGADRRSFQEIAVEIDMMPEGNGRKVEADDVRRWMHAHAANLRKEQFVFGSAGDA